MIYNTAVEQIKGAKTAQSEMLLPILRLATVTSLSNGRAYVQFYGEGSASSKLYPYLSGYKPELNDKVLVFQQGSTYIIAGKISKDNVGDTYYMTKALFDTAISGYLTRAVADTLYEPKGSSSADRIQNNSYYFGFDGSSSTTLVGGRLTGNTTTALNLGTSSLPFNAGYFKTLGQSSSSGAIQTLNVKNATLYGSIIPYSSNSGSIGSSNSYLSAVYTNSLTINTFIASQWKFNSSWQTSLKAQSSSSGGDVYPNGTVNLGTSSYQFNNVRAKQFYQNGTAISTSDRRKKTGIKDFTKKYIDFFKKLKPKLFRFKDGEAGRLHSGFIAQDVEEAAAESGIPTTDLAFLCIDEDGNYGLRYEELIALQTKVIQDLMARVEVLEEKIKGGK